MRSKGDLLESNLPSLWGAKNIVRTSMERERHVGAPVLRGVRALQSHNRRRSLRIAAEGMLGTASEHDVLSVSPESIAHCSPVEFGSPGSRAAVVPGDWDRSTRLFVDSEVFRAMKSVLKDRSCAWSDTAWYRRSLIRLRSGHAVSACRDEAELRARLAELQSLYRSSSREGRGSRGSLAEFDATPVVGGEIAVAVGRNGELLFCDGAPRLGLALLLGIESVAVRVRVRHPSWASLRGELLAYAQAGDGRLYQPAQHSDLAFIASSDMSDSRWDLISARLGRGGGTVLDIGAYLGFFDNKLEDLGYDCTAVEMDATRTYFMKRIRDANGHRFEVVTDSISASGLLREQRYDVVLALSVLHHFLKTRPDHALLETLLDELDCDEMFFEPHLTGERQMAGAYAQLTSEEFTEYVAARTGLAVVGRLGDTGNHRPVYHLRRPMS